ncbi:MAG: hypothetical protein CMO34_02710 [Verrucomicrobia bacterium]|nr:hypothetical protein [Verrucomicrobiota bacterium]|tara:strand:- start:562 stop:861 length:300 start_codon:yes stop_codon:yes gene_type:complete
MSNYTITLQEGIDWTTNFRNQNPSSVKAFKIDQAEINEILAEPNAAGIRAYMGIDNNGNEKLIMVAVGNSGNDILNTVYDHALPCPAHCDDNSVLCSGQ